MPTVPKAWYVTAVLNSERRLDGPFESYDVCQARCLARVDRETALRLIVAGKFPSIYVPRLMPVVGRVMAPPSYGSEKPREKVARTPRGTPVKLPDVIFTYSRAALLTLCDALGIEQPHDVAHATRSTILSHIENTLATWHRGD